MQPIRWTLERAASEFAINPRTLAKRVRRDSILAGPDGRWSTVDISKAIVGDVEGERLRKLKAEADLLELELEQKMGTIANLSDMELAWGNVVVALRQVIKGSNLSQSEKEACLRQIRDSLTGDILKRPEPAS